MVIVVCLELVLSNISSFFVVLVVLVVLVLLVALVAQTTTVEVMWISYSTLASPTD